MSKFYFTAAYVILSTNISRDTYVVSASLIATRLHHAKSMYHPMVIMTERNRQLRFAGAYVFMGKTAFGSFKGEHGAGRNVKLARPFHLLFT